MQIDLFNDYKIKELEDKINYYDKLISRIIWYCNHLNNTKAIYNQNEISNYILNCVKKNSIA